MKDIINLSLVIQWIVMLILGVLCLVFSSNLKKIPNKKQAIVEIYVDTIRKVVNSNMGEGYKSFVPFVGTLAIYLLMLNFVGLFGLEPPTKDYSVALGLGMVSFIVIQAYTIKKVGVWHYILGYTKPVFVLLPINIMERIVFPISLSLRLFGNMFAASIIMNLAYDALAHISWFAQIGAPVFLHAYFDLFDGTLQMIIFVMLTIINIKIISEH